MIFLDSQKLAKARGLALDSIEEFGGIGTLGEKMVHKTLKYYLDENSDNHEVAIEGIVADVVVGEMIYEIQIGSFSRLLPKLNRLLPTGKVTVIYPLITEKTLHWIDPENGEISQIKKSPKRLNAASALSELAHISELMDHPNLTIEVLLIQADEYRLADGRGPHCHKRATKLNLFPNSINRSITINNHCDLAEIFPTKINDPFTAKEFYKAIRQRSRNGYYALKMLEKYGFVSSFEKRGNAVLYKVNNRTKAE